MNTAERARADRTADHGCAGGSTRHRDHTNATAIAAPDTGPDATISEIRRQDYALGFCRGRRRVDRLRWRKGRERRLCAKRGSGRHGQRRCVPAAIRKRHGCGERQRRRKAAKAYKGR